MWKAALTPPLAQWLLHGSAAERTCSSCALFLYGCIKEDKQMGRACSFRLCAERKWIGKPTKTLGPPLLHANIAAKFVPSTSSTMSSGSRPDATYRHFACHANWAQGMSRSASCRKPARRSNATNANGTRLQKLSLEHSYHRNRMETTKPRKTMKMSIYNSSPLPNATAASLACSKRHTCSAANVMPRSQ